MKNRTISILCGIAAMMVACASYSADLTGRSTLYWSDAERGWFWYEDPLFEAEPLQQPTLPPPAQPTKSVDKVGELAAFEKLQKRLENTRKIAYMAPSEANVRRYMELEAKVIAQASYFADVAQRLAWATPSLDPTLQGRPVNAKALEVFNLEQARDRSSSLATLAQDHVIFFFFRGDCPYCHAYAPTLDAMSRKYGMQVVAVSMDGAGLPAFPSPRRDNGIAKTLNVTQVPATFLAQPYSGQITPIGFGVLSESQLVERIVGITDAATRAMLPNLSRRLSLR